MSYSNPFIQHPAISTVASRPELRAHHALVSSEATRQRCQPSLLPPASRHVTARCPSPTLQTITQINASPALCAIMPRRVAPLVRQRNASCAQSAYVTFSSSCPVFPSTNARESPSVSPSCAALHVARNLASNVLLVADFMHPKTHMYSHPTDISRHEVP